MGQLRQRVRLIHKLGELGSTKEFPYRCYHGANVNEGTGRHRFRVNDAHVLLDHPLHAQQPDSELILNQLAYGAHPAVAQMVDVIGVIYPIVHHDNVPDNLSQVFIGEHPLGQGNV